MPADDPRNAAPSQGPILLYDGRCGLCHRAVRFVLRRDRRSLFRFAALQSPLAEQVLARHGVPAADLSTMRLVLEPGSARERLLERSDAALAIAAELGRPWSWCAAFRIVPRPLRDAVYALIARVRYQLFGQKDLCTLPAPAERARFLDAALPPASSPPC